MFDRCSTLVEKVCNKLEERAARQQAEIRQDKGRGAQRQEKLNDLLGRMEEDSDNSEAHAKRFDGRIEQSVEESK